MRTATLSSHGRAFVGLRRMFVTSLTISVLALAGAPAVSGQVGGDSAVGSGFIDDPMNIGGGTEAFTFDASSDHDGGPATGTMTLTGHSADGSLFFHLVATVRCLKVLGSMASVYGEVIHSTTDPVFLGQILRFHMIDNATPGAGQDQFVGLSGPEAPSGYTGTSCAVFHPGFDMITTGEITVVDGQGPDPDGDGFEGTDDNCATVANPDQRDSDLDKVGDACDPDDDNDGVADALDAFPLDPAESADTDRDRVGDNLDNCPTVANFNQADVDSDRIGDACDPVDDRDTDADGVLDTADNCDSVANQDQRDIDSDLIGDACDPEDDRTAAQQLADLITQLQTGPAGPGNSYMAKLQGIADSVAEGDTKGACSKLNAFENEVRAQTGKKLTQTDANALLGESAAIKAKAGC